MIFSRASIKLGSFRPVPPPPRAGDEAGDIGVQSLPTEEIDYSGCFALVADSPRSGAHTITSIPVQTTEIVPPLLAPPIRLTRRSVNGLAFSVVDSSPKPIYVTPGWANNGLCIAGLQLVAPRSSPTPDSMSDATVSTSPDDPSYCSSQLESQLDHVLTSIPTPELPDQFSNDKLLEDCLGVLDVGYPLRPSEACYDLVGLGLPNDAFQCGWPEEADWMSSHPEEDLDHPSSSPPCGCADGLIFDAICRSDHVAEMDYNSYECGGQYLNLVSTIVDERIFVPQLNGISLAVEEPKDANLIPVPSSRLEIGATPTPPYFLSSIAVATISSASILPTGCRLHRAQMLLRPFHPLVCHPMHPTPSPP